MRETYPGDIPVTLSIPKPVDATVRRQVTSKLAGFMPTLIRTICPLAGWKKREEFQNSNNGLILMRGD